MCKGKVVIFGATGTVGAYSAVLLAQHGYEVVGVGRRKDDGGFFETIDGSYYSVDISDKLTLAKLPKDNIVSVLHFAGSMPAKMQGYQPVDYVDSIVKGTLNVLDYCLKSNAGKIVFTQTRADSVEYSGSEIPLPDEIYRKYPKVGDHSVYTICKNAAVDLIEHFYYQHGLRRFIFRLPTIYAYHPETYFHVDGVRKEMAYWYMIRQALQGKPLSVWGDPGKKKEIFYVKDMAKAVLLAVESTLTGGIYNVGRGVGVTLEEQVKGIAEVFSPTESPCDVSYEPDRPDGRQFIHSIEKINKELGFTPEYSYRDMLYDIKEEMKEKPFAKLWGMGDF
jgi:nucleoside-diphosphate-sugar epimerase